MNKTNHFFASANTGSGFINYFNYINNTTKPNYMYIIKGGAGTGKSTLMKKIANYFFKLGEDIEYFYCSSDSTSLDGIRLVKHNIAIVDGTAPHITECNMVGVCDEIINVGEFVLKGISRYKDKIQILLKNKVDCYTNLYEYLKSAKLLLNINLNLYKKSNALVNTEKVTERLSNEIQIKNLRTKATERKLFISSLDNTNLQEHNNFENVIYVNYNLLVTNDILEKLSNLLMQNGYSVTKFYNLVDSTKLQSIYIPLTNTYIKMGFDKNANLYSYKSTIKSNNILIEKLIHLARKQLTKAQSCHKKIEKYYIKNMDFSGLDTLYNTLLIKINNKITTINQ